MTRVDERVAGGCALATAAALVAGTVITGRGPGSSHANAVLAWYAAQGGRIRLGTLALLVAMLLLVAFAIRLRDALLVLVADRWWTGVLFVQGAAVFVGVVVVSLGASWAAADLAASGQADAASVGALWSLHRALLRFAMWGLVVPLLTAGLALFRHSLLGRLAALLGVVVGGLLIVPVPLVVELSTLSGWLALTAVALLRPRRPALDERGAEGPLAAAGPEQDGTTGP